MLVLIHLEWLNSVGVDPYPTQLAALRVDAQWNVTGRFETLIFQPEEPASWTHAGYGSIDAREYHRAPDLEQAAAGFCRWLQPEDVCCWWYESTGGVLRDFMHLAIPGGRAIGTRFVTVVMDRQTTLGTPYRLAQQRGIRCPQPMHVAVNEAETLRLLLQGTRIDQTLLLATRLPSEDVLQEMRFRVLPYWYDEGKKHVHSVSCRRFVPDAEVRRSAGFDLALHRHIPACSCCAEEYRQAVLARNAEIMAGADCLYVYAPHSPVFHRADCGVARRICREELVAETSYKRCKASGRRRCQVCRPIRLKQPQTGVQPPSIPAPAPAKREKPAGAKRRSVPNGHLKQDAQRALRRYQQAQAENLPEGPMSPQELADWQTLAQSTHAFFAAKGYGNFHLRECPRLRGLSDIRGFATFRQAAACNLTPCRHCRPTAGHDLPVAIPRKSHAREGETTEVLDTLCERTGYGHGYNPPYYYITTPVGKWRLNTSERPYRLHHINLVRAKAGAEFHLQPRMFLSFRDAFDYIRRHDETLGKSRGA